MLKLRHRAFQRPFATPPRAASEVLFRPPSVQCRAPTTPVPEERKARLPLSRRAAVSPRCAKLVACRDRDYQRTSPRSLSQEKWIPVIHKGLESQGDIDWLLVDILQTTAPPQIRQLSRAAKRHVLLVKLFGPGIHAHSRVPERPEHPHARAVVQKRRRRSFHPVWSPGAPPVTPSSDRECS